MKIISFLIAVLLVLLWFVAPVQAENASPIKAAGGESQQQLQPLKTYFLDVLPGGSRQIVSLTPPATKLIVSSQSGDTAVRCGDSVRTYSCTPGNPVKISADSATPINRFWAENPHEQQVRLRIDVYQMSALTTEDVASEKVNENST